MEFEVDLNLLQKKMEESKYKFSRVNSNAKIIAEKNPMVLNDRASGLKNQLECWDECEQFLECPPGLTSKIKNGVISGVGAQQVFADTIKNLNVWQSENDLELNHFLKRELNKGIDSTGSLNHDIEVMKALISML